MYKFILSTLVAFTAIAFFACKGDKLKGFEKMPLNYYFKNHTNKKGAVAKIGDVVSFHQYIRKGDSLVQSTRQRGEAIKAQIPEGNKTDKFLNAIKIGRAHV